MNRIKTFYSKTKYKSTILLLLFITSSISASSQFSFTIPRSYDIGYISSDSNGRYVFGTAFIIGNSEVMTCAHVIDSLCKKEINFKNPNIFYLANGLHGSIRLVISKIDYEADFSYLKAGDTISKYPLKISNNYSSSIGRLVLY